MLLPVPVLIGTAGCATNSPVASACVTASLQQVVDDPLRYAGSYYCGEGLVALRGRSVQIIRTSADLSSMDTVLLATSATSPRFEAVAVQPKRYYLEARIDPQAECFEPPADNGETCSPWRRPVSMHIRQATLLRQ